MPSPPPSQFTQSIQSFFLSLASGSAHRDFSWEAPRARDPGTPLATIDGSPYRVVGVESLGWGVRLYLLGARYELACRERSWPKALGTVIERERTRCRFHLLALHSDDPSAPPIPLATLLEDYSGDYHLVQTSMEERPDFWATFSLAAHLLTERDLDPARFDDYGDFSVLGAPSIVQRHSTERLRKHLSQKMTHDARLCSHCLLCATGCNEMRVALTEEGARVLGPAEDFCTSCGLCRRHCSYLMTTPKEDLPQAEGPRGRITEGGAAVHLYGPAASELFAILSSVEAGGPASFPYTVSSFIKVPAEHRGACPIRGQLELSPLTGWPRPGPKPLAFTLLESGSEEGVALLRRSHRTALVLQTDKGEIEREIGFAAMRLGVLVRPVADPGRGGISIPANDTARLFFDLGQPAALGQSLADLWDQGRIDMVLAPFQDRVPAEVQRKVLEQTGRQAQVLAPHIPQGLPVTRSPLFAKLASALSEIFAKHPALMEEEARTARELLADVGRSHALIHARYRSMAFASGHSACPTCAEAQVLAIPVYMAMAMSFARGEAPQVFFTCETGCMSETLNKTGEVSQKVPGGRTVFGGGFAFGEAMAIAQDRAVRMGLLRKGRRYVVSQGGDGGAVIGLPAWLNALRQQASLIRHRHPNVLHFISITDTQVYSNTGGESSASSLLGMGTLTTPIGKFLLGNQKIQWSLINLAAEFPGILVGAGHSGNRSAMQQFWQLADRTGQSAIRWDVTPCPETGKFFGEDPDDLAQVMAHAGMIPEVTFVGRLRKRIAPFHPEDRQKPCQEWGLRPKPVLYWLQRDPRYKALLRKSPQTGEVEPRNLTAHFLISQLESYRDQINWQIDLETLLVRRAEGWTSEFFRELEEEWSHFRYRLDQFPYAMLFNRQGRLKPEYDTGLQQEMVRRIIGWDEMARYTKARDGFLESRGGLMERFLALLGELDAFPVHGPSGIGGAGDEGRAVDEIVSSIRALQGALHDEAEKLKSIFQSPAAADPIEEEAFDLLHPEVTSLPERRRRDLHRLLNRIIEERALGKHVELQQYRLSQQLKESFLTGGGLIRQVQGGAPTPEREKLLRRIGRIGPFSIGVASLAGDRGIAINRVFAGFMTAKGAWAGMAWQFGSSKRGTPVLSATVVDTRPIQRKDAMHSFPMAVLTVTNYEEMKRQPDLFFAQLMPGGFLIVNHKRSAESLFHELLSFYPQEVRDEVTRYLDLGAAELKQGTDPSPGPTQADALLDRAARLLFERPFSAVREDQRLMARKVAAIAHVRMVAVDMDGIMRLVAGSPKVVSNLVAIAPIFQALRELGLPLSWDRDLQLLSQGFPEAVIRNSSLLGQYYQAMERARVEARAWGPLSGEKGFSEEVDAQGVFDHPGKTPAQGDAADAEDRPHGSNPMPSDSSVSTSDSPAEYLMIMGGTLAGMVLSQIATARHPLFYVGFPITPAGNPFYAMAEAFANGHPYIVVDEVNPSEKVAAEKLLGIARTGGFLPVTFTASQGWRLFTEIIPQFVGARLEGLFLIAKRALAAPNLNIEESHTDFMSFRDDGGIMLAPKSIQEFVPSLYLARLLTHFAKLPVILSIGGITDTHKIGLVKVPSDLRVRDWLAKTLKDFDFLEHKLLNRQGDLIVHGPSGTSAVYQETQSEIEKAHQAAMRIYPYAVEAVSELTGVRLEEIEVTALGPHQEVDTLFILQGSLYPNAVEALRELGEEGWTGLACLSIRCFNPFPEEKLLPWLDRARRVMVMDRSNSFGSVPPLASRIFTAFARLASGGGDGAPKPLRTLVGGLGGREITVHEMKEILLSTHLLLDPPEEWEKPLIEKLIEEDNALRAMIEEAAALDLRSTERHTRVPRHLRTLDRQRQEYVSHLSRTKGLLARKDYTHFLASYNQVEFLGAREVLQESSLLQQIVAHLEIRLAGHAMQTGRGRPRHALISLHYGADAAQRALAMDLLRQEVQRGAVSHRLAEKYDVREDTVRAPGPDEIDGGPVGESNAPDAPAAPETGPSLPAAPPVVPFDPDEARRIEAILTRLVTRQGEEPLFYNPEDFEHELIHELQTASPSPLFDWADRLRPDEADDLIRAYQNRYRDLIDSTLLREVLTQHYAPELQRLFSGEGLRKIQELARRISQELPAGPLEKREKMVCEEIERYLTERCLPQYPKSPLFYLDYFRSCVAPDLAREHG